MTTKRITLEITAPQHAKLKTSAKQYQITQQELLALIIDLTLTNIDTIKPHAEKFRRKKLAEEQRQKDLQRKAENLIAKLPQDKLDKLLAGGDDLLDLLK